MATADTLQQRLQEVKSEIERLRANVEVVKASVQNGGLSSLDATRRPLGPVLKRKKVLTGHVSRVYAIDWAGDSQHVLSASQDGNMIVWNALKNHKIQVISLRSTWVMTCAYERSGNSLVACGGLDNVCTIYNVGAGDGGLGTPPARVMTELHGHEGYVSSAQFVANGTHMLTASGDSTCIFWDIERSEPLWRFTDHTSDVMSVSSCPAHPALFVSGSTDSTAKTWDLRSGKCTQTFVGHESDINAVAYMRHGQVFGTASDDCTVKLFEQRSYSRINEMANDTVMFASTSLDFSLSGRLLFAGYDDCNAYGWDSLADSAPSPVQALLGHSNRVSCIGVSPSGEAICTGSWDHDIAIWA